MIRGHNEGKALGDHEIHRSLHPTPRSCSGDQPGDYHCGLQAVRSLNVRQFPRSENSVVTVTTVYVGASAELVRGFITTPIERAIAAADGIDYIESQSTQGLSTITTRLKLNYDQIKALSEISSKVDQVRRDLPPEAEVPAINVESATAGSLRPI